ncbi:serine/threonine dehydratase [Rickettsia rhipicephali]|uniref:serine/threonine dehydratase n=1 Tax=Rickettsia rhipicephali TaxID=33992 RepID=UPI0022568F44|nr:serine/threonine dehydratase [Rickettsia rhipicephali]MCX4079629.1 serine/threonine dehydratase [Rickettsia rhipicephali]
MNLLLQPPQNVAAAHNRIKQYLHLTPIVHSESLNEMLGHEIFFKVESLQKTGAFKVRGVLNHLLKLKEQGKLPDKIVGYSTGNHGIGLAYASKLFGIKTRIYLPLNTSKVKQQAALYYGGEVIYTYTRQEAEEKAKEDEKQGFYYMHPSDSDSTIAGAGTLCYEALQQLGFSPDAIFASCGGGGLISGAYLAKELISPTSLLIGSEPVNANDAYLSVKDNKTYRFNYAPNTIADGLKTLSVSARTFEYLKKLDDFYLAEEYEIYYWTAWLIHLLKVICEPSSSINMVSVVNFLKTQSKPQKLLVLISGGNIDPILYNELWKEEYLSISPKSLCSDVISAKAAI